MNLRCGLTLYIQGVKRLLLGDGEMKKALVSEMVERSDFESRGTG